MFKALFGSSKNPTKERNESPRSDDQDALPLHAAIRNHEAKEVKKTADKGGEKAVAAVDKQGRNSLHVAAEASEAELIKVLVSAVQTSKRSELINAKDRHGCTPLFYACVAGSKKSVQELLRLGADVSTTNIIQETLLHAIFRAPFMSKSHVSVVQELLTTQKLPLNALDHENQTALQIACRFVFAAHPRRPFPAHVRSCLMLCPSLGHFCSSPTAARVHTTSPCTFFALEPTPRW